MSRSLVSAFSAVALGAALLLSGCATDVGVAYSDPYPYSYYGGPYYYGPYYGPYYHGYAYYHHYHGHYGGGGGHHGGGGGHHGGGGGHHHH